MPLLAPRRPRRRGQQPSRGRSTNSAPRASCSRGGQTLGGLIDRYVTELWPTHRWGRTKTADLARLKKDLGHLDVTKLTSHHLTEYFGKRFKSGSGPVVIASQAGYLIHVLKVARTTWHLDVPLQAALDARQALTTVRMTGKAKRRDRRVTDSEIAALITHFRLKPRGGIPLPDILQFCVATAMRISEVCRLEWRDLDETNKTIMVRDRKHPTDKIGNDQLVPLLSASGYDALDIIKRQWKAGARVFPYKSRTISTLVTRAAVACKLEDFHLHDLRHEGISRLFEAGYRIEQVALVSGHRDWAMLRRYTHVRAADLHGKKKDKMPAVMEDRK